MGFEAAAGWSPFTLDSSLLGGAHVLQGGGTDAGLYDWVDVSAFVESPVVASLGGGSSDGPLFRAGCGRASFTLTNLDGRFDPLNVSGPYYGLLGPGVPVKITATPSGLSPVTVFVGRVDDWPVGHYNDWWSDVRLSASNDVEALAASNPGNQALALPVQTTTDRCAAILERAGWPVSLSDIESSTAMGWEQQSTDLGQSTWAELQLAADSGDAWLWVDASDVVNVAKTLPTTPAVRLGNTGVAGVIPLTDYRPAESTRARQVNRIEVDVPYSDPQLSWVVEDLVSQARYGLRSWGRSDMMTWPGLALYFHVVDLVDRWKDPVVWHPEQVTVEPEAASTAGTLLSVSVGALVEVQQRTPDGRTVTATGYVSGVSWSFSPTGRPRVTYELFPPRPPAV